MKINAITLCNPVDLRPPLNKLEASASANWFAASFRVWAKLACVREGGFQKCRCQNMFADVGSMRWIDRKKWLPG